MIWIIWILVIPGLVMAIDAALQGPGPVFQNAMPSLWIYLLYCVLVTACSVDALRARVDRSRKADRGWLCITALSALTVAGSFFNMFSPVMILGALTYGAISNNGFARLVGGIGYLAAVAIVGTRFYFFETPILGYGPARPVDSGGLLAVDVSTFLVPAVVIAIWVVFEQTARIVERGVMASKVIHMGTP